MHGEKRNAYRVLLRKPKGKIKLERHENERENIIEMDLREMLSAGMDWIAQTEDGVHTQ
jgi:hypothetical protein